MSQEELNLNALEYQRHMNLPTLPNPIAKKNLVVGAKYSGICRNSYEAVWNGKEFEYKRFKFGFIYDDTINHYEDDDGYDVFVPFERC